MQLSGCFILCSVMAEVGNVCNLVGYLKFIFHDGRGRGGAKNRR